jgi:DNA-binding IclR family transcriptional regulator
MSASLERGLKILAILAKKNQPVRFNELNKNLGNISRASLSRLLKSMIESGHVDKNNETGAYSCGAQMACFSNVRKKNLRESLISSYAPLIKEAAKKFNVTIILLEKVKDILINIHKEQPEYSMFMQEVNNINDKAYEPWLLTIAAYCPEIAKKIKSNKYQKIINEVKSKGYLYENQTVRSEVRRFSFPVFLNEEIVGIIGVGGTILQIDDEKAEEIIEFFGTNK